MINLEEFTGKYYASANDLQKKDIARFLQNLSMLIGKKSPENALKDEKFLCKTFYIQQAGNNISRPHYQKIKEYLINVFAYLGIDSVVPTRDEVIASKEIQGYFKGIDDLLKFIDSIGKVKISDYNPTTDLIRVKAICVLGWIGLSTAEISNLKKSDLIPIGSNGYKVVTETGTYEIYGEPFAVLYYLKDLKEYKSLPSALSHGRQIILKSNGEYLFRSQNVECEKLNDKQIIQVLHRFNNSFNVKTNIIFRNLKKNALFLEIFNDKRDVSVTEKIMEKFNCSYYTALSHREQYYIFENALLNNKI